MGQAIIFHSSVIAFFKKKNTEVLSVDIPAFCSPDMMLVELVLNWTIKAHD